MSAAMVIKELVIERLGKIDHLRLRPAETGVTVIYGDNECGKTTMLNALRMVLDAKSNTTSKDIVSLWESRGDDSARIAAELIIGDQHFRIDKTYRGRGGSTNTTLQIFAPTPQTYTGRQAEDELKNIIDNTLDRSLMDLLVVKQGESLEDVSLTQLRSLESRLDNPEGEQARQAATSSGDGAGAEPISLAAEGLENQLLATVWEKLTAEYSQFYTDKGKPKKSLNQLAAAVEEKKAALDSAQADYAECQQRIAELEHCGHAKRDNEQELPAAKQKVAELEEELHTARENAAKLAGLENKLAAAAKAVEVAQLRLEDKEHTDAEIADLNTQVNALEEKMRAAEAELQRQKEEHSTAQAAAAAAEKDHLYLSHWKECISALRKYRQGQDTVRSCEEKIKAITAAEEEHQRAAAALREHPGDPKRINQAREALHELDHALQENSRATTAVTITGNDGDTYRVNQEERTLSPGGDQLRVTDHTTLQLGDFHVTLQPSADSQARKQRVDSAHQELRAALANAGIDPDAEGLLPADYAAAISCQEVFDAEKIKAALWQQDAAHSELESTVHTTRARCESLTAEFSVTQLQQQREAAADDCAVQQKRYATAHQQLMQRTPQPATSAVDAAAALLGEHNLLADTPQLSVNTNQADTNQADTNQADTNQADNYQSVATPPSEAEIEQLIAPYASAAVKARTTLEAIDLSTAQKNVEELTNEHGKIKAKLAQKQQRDSETPGQSISELRATLTEAHTAHTTLEAELTAARQNPAAQHDVDNVAEQLGAARTFLTNLEASIQHHRETEIRLHASLQNSAGAPEKVKALESDYRAAQNEYATQQHRARTAELLHRKLNAARAQRLQQYFQPLTQQLNELSQLVYGANSTFAISENMEVSVRHTTNPNSGHITSTETKHLSGGTREQLWILLRLAISGLIGKGERMPIIIDDALGFSDPQRLRNMNIALSRLGKEAQVIITTCDAKRFNAISGATIRPFNQLRPAPEEETKQN